MSVRIFRGDTRTLREVIEHCATDHLSHRLLWIGFSQVKAVLFIYLMGIVFGITGVLMRTSDSVTDSALALFQGVAVVAIIVILMATAGAQQFKSIEEETLKFNKEASENERVE